MNSKTEDLISKVMEKAASAADYTAQKAGQVVESTKLNFRLYELNGTIGEYERRIGQIVYAAHQGETADQTELDELLAKLDAAKVRVETDLRNEKIGYKIREAQMQKIPYMLVVGDKEAEAGTVSVRTRRGEDLGAMSLADFSALLRDVVDSKARQ